MLEANKNVMESRIIGVEVVCGPLDAHFIYYTVDLVGHGGNVMIEVLRQTLIDAARILRESYNLVLPRELFLHYDNCKENKNAPLFAYLSMMIETYEFDKIRVNFLVVGHTHSSIDQFFSVLRKLIEKGHFIGSPLSLINLVMKDREFEDYGVRVMRQLTTIYEVFNVFAWFIVNPTVHFLNIPYCFEISRWSSTGVAIMQYKLFTPHTQWLPVAPANCLVLPRQESESQLEFQTRCRQLLSITFW